MNRVAWIEEKSGFQKNLEKKFDLENFRSESFSIHISYIESSNIQARVAKGKPAFRNRITETSSPGLCIDG